MENRKIDILNMAETKHRGEEKEREVKEEYVLLFKGTEKRKENTRNWHGCRTSLTSQHPRCKTDK